MPVHTHNKDREIVKARKLYFSDTGLLRILAGDIDSGALFENAVFAQLRHKGDIRYFSLKTGREIDFVFNGAAGTLPCLLLVKISHLHAVYADDQTDHHTITFSS